MLARQTLRAKLVQRSARSALTPRFRIGQVVGEFRRAVSDGGEGFEYLPCQRLDRLGRRHKHLVPAEGRQRQFADPKHRPANTYRVDPALAGRRVELVFSPFDLETIEVRYRQSFGAAVAHTITRHAHPKARPETAESAPPATTGIDYLALTAAAHHEQLRHDERIGYHALYGPDTGATDGALGANNQIPGQLSITDLDPTNADHEGGFSA
jgi:hypothetical protein